MTNRVFISPKVSPAVCKSVCTVLCLWFAVLFCVWARVFICSHLPAVTPSSQPLAHLLSSLRVHCELRERFLFNLAATRIFLLYCRFITVDMLKTNKDPAGSTTKVCREYIFDNCIVNHLCVFYWLHSDHRPQCSIMFFLFILCWFTRTVWTLHPQGSNSSFSLVLELKQLSSNLYLSWSQVLLWEETHSLLTVCRSVWCVENSLSHCHCSNRLQQEGCSHVVPRGGEDYSGGNQKQWTNCGGGEVRDELYQIFTRHTDMRNGLGVTQRCSRWRVIQLFSSCRSLVDTVYSLKDEVQELKQVSNLSSFLQTVAPCSINIRQ